MNSFMGLVFIFCTIGVLFIGGILIYDVISFVGKSRKWTGLERYRLGCIGAKKGIFGLYHITNKHGDRFTFRPIISNKCEFLEVSIKGNSHVLSIFEIDGFIVKKYK